MHEGLRVGRKFPEKTGNSEKVVVSLNSIHIVDTS